MSDEMKVRSSEIILWINPKYQRRMKAKKVSPVKISQGSSGSDPTRRSLMRKSLRQPGCVLQLTTVRAKGLGSGPDSLWAICLNFNYESVSACQDAG
jgi:hypothetical protein